MSNKTKFFISAIPAFLVATGLIFWSYQRELDGKVGISSVAIIMGEFAVITLLGWAFKINQPKRQVVDGDKK